MHSFRPIVVGVPFCYGVTDGKPELPTGYRYIESERAWLMAEAASDKARFYVKNWRGWWSLVRQVFIINLNPDLLEGIPEAGVSTLVFKVSEASGQQELTFCGPKPEPKKPLWMI
jgi:hypothetical protein